MRDDLPPPAIAQGEVCPVRRPTPLAHAGGVCVDGRSFACRHCHKTWRLDGRGRWVPTWPAS